MQFLTGLVFVNYMLTNAQSFLVRRSTQYMRAFCPHMTSTSLSALPNNAGTLGSRNLPSNLVVVIAGPTGVGKSEIAAKLCTECQGMIVSADSVQVYRGVQIGANKPTKEERAEVPHLLVDMVDASDQYNAADWRRDALPWCSS